MVQQGPHLLCVAAPWRWDGVSKREERYNPVPGSPERSPGRRPIHRGPAKGPMTSRPEGGLGLEKPGVLGGQPEPPKLLAHRDVAPLRRHLSTCPSASSGLGRDHLGDPASPARGAWCWRGISVQGMGVGRPNGGRGCGSLPSPLAPRWRSRAWGGGLPRGCEELRP